MKICAGRKGNFFMIDTEFGSVQGWANKVGRNIQRIDMFSSIRFTLLTSDALKYCHNKKTFPFMFAKWYDCRKFVLSNTSVVQNNKYHSFLSEHAMAYTLPKCISRKFSKNMSPLASC